MILERHYQSCQNVFTFNFLFLRISRTFSKPFLLMLATFYQRISSYLDFIIGISSYLDFIIGISSYLDLIIGIFGSEKIFR